MFSVTFRPPIPWVPWGALENLRTSRLQNASPRFHSAPLAPTAAHRQLFRGPRGPRVAKCVTTHFCRASLAAPPRPPVISVCRRAARSRLEPPGACAPPRSRRGKLAFPAVLTRFQGPAPWRTPRPRARLARFPNKSREFKERAPNLSKSQLPSGHPGRRAQTLRNASSPQGI